MARYAKAWAALAAGIAVFLKHDEYHDRAEETD